ncbi:hypothetical protein SLEP1_g30875 [Rubroshorea leprosula]|uniref:SOSEKI DIX-like domain-containing protein n=1 Tax=Rubroshorea leprosula TaxID=152421 RepID=A0AAV5K6Y6_9ROSI|nr:hypothetical protein SLEP1_g30875 [Rubroshorea leprosula]
MEPAGKEDGEVKKLDIIYFLTRMGHMEHPHLLRVQHLNGNSVYLRDVKRWLADLRGKEMPEAFSWSCKRRYKSGYVWQDLMDADLIIPVCDSEYVLKGSQLIPNNNVPLDATRHFQKRAVDDEQASMDHAPAASNPSSQVYKHSPQYGSERSTLTEDDSMEHELVTSKLETSHLLNNDNFSLSSNTKSPSCTKTKSSKTNSSGTGASHIFRNLLTCGAVDTNDAVLVVLNRSTKITNSGMCKGDKLRGSPTAWTQQHHTAWDSNSKKDNKEAGFGSPKVVSAAKVISAAYRPVGEPSCSQCGKPFKPEKLHSHMKSCKGMKTCAKTSSAFVKKTPVNSSYQQSATGYFLTN